MKKYIFNAGRYYVGDLCYVLSDEQWDSVLEQTGCFGYEPFSSVDENSFVINGQKGWAHPTVWGDGSYEGTNGNEYWVDSGSIGIISIEALEDGPDFRGGYEFIDFDEDFEVFYDNGCFTFGEIEIQTGNEELANRIVL